MLTIKNIMFLFFSVLSFSVKAQSLNITITKEQQDYFHDVACTSDASALIRTYSSQPEEYKSEILELTGLTNRAHEEAIKSGIKAGKNKSQIEQFIQLQTEKSYKFNMKYIAENGFEKFHKSAIGGLYVLCRTTEKEKNP